jgi:hypothetical protein
MISVTKVASGELITASPEAYAFLHFRCIQRIYCSKQSIALPFEHFQSFYIIFF